MTMTIPPVTEETNIVRITSFSIYPQNKNILVQFEYGFKNGAGDVVSKDTATINLGEVKYNQLMNLTPPGNKTFKEWIRPLIYAQIADHLVIPVGDID